MLHEELSGNPCALEEGEMGGALMIQYPAVFLQHNQVAF